MRIAIAIAVLVISGAARAEPCTVTIKGGTPYLRTTIAHRVIVEHRCTSMAVELDITDHGDIFVAARLPTGRMHQRVVPDIQAASAVVAGWADDRLVSTEPCTVRIKGGTRYLRGAVARWVTAEPRCTSMEVELDITDQRDILVAARVSTGRLYQHVVPDIEAAGALVATWAAVDHPR